MQFQAELGEPLLEFRETASGVGLLAETDHKIVGITHDDDFAFRVAFPPSVNPLVQYVVQEHVR